MHALYIGHVWPEPHSSAGGYRTLGLVNAFLENKFELSFCCAAATNEHSFALNQLGVKCYDIELNNNSFDLLLKKIKPDIIIFDRFMTEEQYAWRVDKVIPSAVKILDTVDLHFLRRARQIEHKKQLLNDQQKITSEIKQLNLQSEDSIREIASILRCDLSLIISSFEYQLLIKKFNIDSKLLVYCPFMLTSDDNKSNNNFEQRQNFIQIGNFIHAPNWDALLWTKKHIWPLIRRQLKSAECHIYGAYSTNKVEQLHDEKNGFFIKGRAYNLNELMKRYRINLAPLRFGAGIKGKIADGYINGLPNITTPIGAEGMCDKHHWGGIIADTTESFANAAIDLYQDKDHWLQAQQNGFKCIESIHNEKKIQKVFIEKVTTIFDNLKAHRQSNFLGTMLNYHFHQRTKYLSRWIEEKNKNQMD
ncbi:MAG: glycosyltransferase [Gammaproteobacteria bacterium]|nr:glycosyltransferase [Gammaproteobacteria bacterium]